MNKNQKIVLGIIIAALLLWWYLKNKPSKTQVTSRLLVDQAKPVSLPHDSPDSNNVPPSDNQYNNIGADGTRKPTGNVITDAPTPQPVRPSEDNIITDYNIIPLEED